MLLVVEDGLLLAKDSLNLLQGSSLSRNGCFFLEDHSLVNLEGEK